MIHQPCFIPSSSESLKPKLISLWWRLSHHALPYNGEKATWSMGELQGTSRFLSMAFNRAMLLFLLASFPRLLLMMSVSLQSHRSHPHSLTTDKAALIAFKMAILADPNDTLANWDASGYVCNFTGVVCRHTRVTMLVLMGLGLQGSVSPMVSNLTGLRVLNLADNHFYGMIPTELSTLRHLRHLMLDGNALQGSIPESFSLLSNLTVLTLSENNLGGVLPASFLSNCTLLSDVDLSQNQFSGQIPAQIGNCPNLWNLNLYNNQFTGQLPSSLINASQMYNLDVEYNHLTGELPSKIVAKLPLLDSLHLSYTNMVSHDNNTNLDPFFSSLSNCSYLSELELAGMGLGGKLPESIGRLTANLSHLLLMDNLIFGPIPRGLANLSSLLILNMTGNMFNGTVPGEISKLPHLQQLFLSRNDLSGEIPEGFGELSRLDLLDLSYNRFSGSIPSSLGNLVQVSSLFLNNNVLSGSIPKSIWKCIDLYRLDLSYNRLTGIIPPEISSIREIRIFLNLSHNKLQGPLPVELSKLQNVQEVDLSWNNLSGSIFPQISNCIAMRVIKFSHNSLHGSLPASLSDLKNLEYLDVSVNLLSGEIPKNLSRIKSLTFLNLSVNNFQGMIPSGGIFDIVTDLSFLDNPRLCGLHSSHPTCPSVAKHWFHSRLFVIVFTSLMSVMTLLLLVCCGLLIWRIKDRFSAGSVELGEIPAGELIYNIPRITHRELSEATDGFDSQRLIGSGSFGHVYKGVLPDGTVIAVKVLQLQTGNSTRSFNRECQVLKRIRHRNLIRIITACSLPDFKALVLPYMANGSLDYWLYQPSSEGPQSRLSDLSLIQRVNICSDIAEGMAYLHHHSPVRVVHCDLKPSNILLNDDMTALVSDFGIARLIFNLEAGSSGTAENSVNSTANMLCGSVGYIAPEYGFGSSTSTNGDVYSFGVIVLEMVTRKRPVDEMFSGGLSLQRWVKSHYHHGSMEMVVDPALLRAVVEQDPEVKRMWEAAIGELIELGIVCTQDSPYSRHTMVDAADDLDRLKKYLNGDATTTATFASSLGVSSSAFGDD